MNHLAERAQSGSPRHAEVAVLEAGCCYDLNIPLGISSRKWWAWAPPFPRDLDFMGFPSLTTCIL